jgi:predicted AAA+ superfamily ATPase
MTVDSRRGLKLGGVDTVVGRSATIPSAITPGSVRQIRHRCGNVRDMQATDALYPRHARRAVTAALTDTRVVVINGARQTGKSTLARLVMAEFGGSELRYLDEAPMRAAAQADPGLFVRHNGLLVIDEVQRVPDLFLAIKHEVDVDPRPGRFLLTGSARLVGLRDIPDLLPGRSETIELSPLSQGELGQGPDGFIDAVFRHGVSTTVPRSALRRDDYVERALRGGYPEAVRRTDAGRRARFFEAYISDLINRDVRQLAEIERPADMRRLVNLMAASTGSLANPASMASRLQVPASTVKRYLDLLDLLFITRRIPAWSSNLATRAVAAPKLLLSDSGLAAHLTGMSLKRARHPTAPVGPLIETFVLGELARQLAFTGQPVRLYHYRDRDQYEVDAVLESASGEVIACEVKAAETVRSEDFRGIQRLSRRLGDQLVAGIVLYAGGQPLPFGDRLRAWPISSLWTLAPDA